jgi:hypothetical protein
MLTGRAYATKAEDSITTSTTETVKKAFFSNKLKKSHLYKKICMIPYALTDDKSFAAKERKNL